MMIRLIPGARRRADQTGSHGNTSRVRSSGVKLSFTEDALKSVAVRAISRKTGARGLRSIMEQILLGTMFELPGLDGVEEVVINREVAESRANPEEVC